MAPGEDVGMNCEGRVLLRSHELGDKIPGEKFIVACESKENLKRNFQCIIKF
jgi:hypothetical protein